jgi:hypothetical protein
MATVPEELLSKIATRVAQQISNASPDRVPERFVLLVLSGASTSLDGALVQLARSQDRVVAMMDCPTASADALAAARTRIASAMVLTEPLGDVETIVAKADRLVAPSMDLALSSRVASLQSDSPGARAILRALFRGIAVEASLDEREFRISDRASEGARRALEQVASRLRELGVNLTKPAPFVSTPLSVGSRSFAQNSAVSTTVGRHPSQDRFELPRSVDEFVDFLEQKGCSLEPGKPCIDCGACEARGF